MRVLTETPDRLVLEDRPWQNGLLFAFVTLVGTWIGMKGYQTDKSGTIALGAALCLAGLYALLRSMRVLRVSIDRDGAVTIATWRGRGWQSRTIPPCTTWARLTLVRTRGLRGYGVTLDVTEGDAPVQPLMVPVLFGYARASDAVRRINLRLREPALDPAREDTGPQRWLELDRKPRRR